MRRMKTDKKIVPELPEKNEINVYIELGKRQLALYQKIVSELKEENKYSNGEFESKRLIVTAIMHLKQICNHPSQYTGDKLYTPEDSGKFQTLQEICESIRDRQERVLIFTQFKEIAEPLNIFLEKIFDESGRIITGDTTLKKRNEYVDDFQMGKIPYMVLSLKAAGVGLNLTKANNVIHFDRWWNPAVEEQATDRAFRIGQTKNVNVYKFIAKNTLEEIINKMQDTKSLLFDSVLGNTECNAMSKLSSVDLIKLMEYSGEYYG